jgi:hypothetical protein
MDLLHCCILLYVTHLAAYRGTGDCPNPHEAQIRRNSGFRTFVAKALWQDTFAKSDPVQTLFHLHQASHLLAIKQRLPAGLELLQTIHITNVAGQQVASLRQSLQEQQRVVEQELLVLARQSLQAGENPGQDPRFGHNRNRWGMKPMDRYTCNGGLHGQANFGGLRVCRIEPTKQM